jgi:RNA polymerase sigma factor (sigma-70 family)
MTDIAMDAQPAGPGHAAVPDDRRLEHVIRTHRAMVRGVLGRMLPADEVDDAEQAVYLILHRRRGFDLDARDIGPWLHRTAVLVARNAARRRATRLRHVGSMHDLPEPAQPHEDPSLVAALLPHLDAALDELPVDQRQVVIAHHLQGTSLVQIAERMGIPVNTAYTRAHRGIEKLRKILVRKAPGLSTAGVVVLLGIAGPTAAAMPDLPPVPSDHAASLATTTSGSFSGAIAWSVAVLTLVLTALAGYVAADRDPPPPMRVTVAADERPRDAYLGLTITWAGQTRLLPDGRRGIPIEVVAPGSPAAEAGLRPGDVLVRVDGQRLSTNSEIKLILRPHRPGDRIPIAFFRDGSLQAVEVVLAGVPSVAVGHPADAQPADIIAGRWIDDDPLRGWSAANPLHPLQVVERADAEGPAPGIPAMRITTLPAPSASWAGAAVFTRGPTDQRLQQLHGKRVRFSAMVRCEGESVRSFLWMVSEFNETESHPRRVSAYDDMTGGRELSPAVGWRRMETVLDVEPGIGSLRIGASLRGLGRVWVASPRLEVVDDSIPSTSLPEKVAEINQSIWEHEGRRWAATAAAVPPSATTARGSEL